ncbi:putative transcription factor WRKY family [Helianthus annuus]|nr:putative transcription factor WRKY family [Helianthus annuus]KAJ0719981.1 putative transcription factor WRKY family [Helianthus annuus]KAJ0723205.1 putative transcription factor WRKY family [Helianthus annuus]
MGGFDDHVGVIGDWMAPSPSPRSFFSAMLREAGSGPVAESEPEPEPPKDDNRADGFTFHGPDKQFGLQNGGFGEPKVAGSRSGLVERMAARAGYNAPRLDTDSIRPSADVAKQSPYLTIPPGLSPTSLLDSPVFLSNSLAQPSPTTGKFQFAPNKDHLSEQFDTSSFAFKTVPEPAPISNKVNPPFMPWQTIETAQNGGVNGNTVQEHNEEDGDQLTNGDSGNHGSDDGYNWRKYGQKQVKGSEFPRSYYKCTHANCPVKKKVERSHEGHITEIIYKGAHNHPKPPPGRRSGFGSCSDVQGGTEWGQDGNLEVTSSAVNHHGTQFENSDPVDGSLTFSNDEEGEDDDRATHGSVSLGCDGEGDESESKRRKVEAYAADVSGATRAIREPRVVVQTTSEVDILDDGYRWRKYGQKVVKGNPNPRSYYKCTSTGCTVRKHVERASHDLKSVITTYEGKHNHDVPAARNSSHNSTSTQAQSVQPSQVHNPMARFDRTQYGLQAGPHGYGYGVNLTQMAMAGLVPNQAKMPVHPFLGQISDMGMMVPKGEPKAEPVSHPGLNLAANGSSIYHHQFMNRLPLGPQM